MTQENVAMIDKMKEAIFKISKEYNFDMGKDITADMVNWYIIGINTFISSYLEENLKDVEYQLLEGDPIRTLDHFPFTNRVYSWKITAENALIMISFNDLTFKFNSMIAFNVLNEDTCGERVQYSIESEDNSEEELIRFIVSEVDAHKNYL